MYFIIGCLQGGPKSGETTFDGRTTFSALIFKTPQPISMTFDTLQRRFTLNTSVDSKIIKFIKQGGAT